MSELDLKSSDQTFLEQLKKLASPWTVVVLGPSLVALLDPGNREPAELDAK